jgi:hypothetical protein
VINNVSLNSEKAVLETHYNKYTRPSHKIQPKYIVKKTQRIKYQTREAVDDNIYP